VFVALVGQHGDPTQQLRPCLGLFAAIGVAISLDVPPTTAAIG